jgi:hypothetical protein
MEDVLSYNVIGEIKGSIRKISWSCGHLDSGIWLMVLMMTEQGAKYGSTEYI